MAVSIAASFLYGKQVSVPVVGYVVRLLIGEADFVSFTPLYFLSYALFGVAFGKMLRRVTDKTAFYRRLAVPSVLISSGLVGGDVRKIRSGFVRNVRCTHRIIHAARSFACGGEYSAHPRCCHTYFFIGRRGHAGGGQKGAPKSCGEAAFVL